MRGVRRAGIESSDKGSHDTLAVAFLPTHALITIPVDVLGLDRRQFRQWGGFRGRGDAQSPPVTLSPTGDARHAAAEPSPSTHYGTY